MFADYLASHMLTPGLVFSLLRLILNLNTGFIENDDNLWK